MYTQYLWPISPISTISPMQCFYRLHRFTVAADGPMCQCGQYTNYPDRWVDCPCIISSV